MYGTGPVRGQTGKQAPLHQVNYVALAAPAQHMGAKHQDPCRTAFPGRAHGHAAGGKSLVFPSPGPQGQHGFFKPQLVPALNQRQNT